MREVWLDGPIDELRDAVAAALDGGPTVLPLAAGSERLRDAMSPGEPIEPDTAVIIATSGSTGEPKGVLLSAGALRASAEATHARLGGPGHWLLATPAQYIGGLQVIVRSLVAGTTCTALPPGPFRPERFAEAAALVGDSPRYTALVPTQLTRLLDAGGAGLAAARSFDAIIIGAAATSSALRERAAEAGVRIVPAYGMSETASGCVYDGTPLDGVRIALVDADGECAAPAPGDDSARVDPDPDGRPVDLASRRRPVDLTSAGRAPDPAPEGRILLAGPVLAHGYRLRPDLTAESFASGWFRTGDRGRLVNGRLEVLGRMDGLINTGGVKVSAAAVERALAGCAGVRESCVVGLPDAEWGEIVVAAVIPEGEAPDVADLRAAVRAAAGAAAVPKRVAFVDTLPLRGPGKIDRTGVMKIFHTIG